MKELIFLFFLFPFICRPIADTIIHLTAGPIDYRNIHAIMLHLPVTKSQMEKVSQCLYDMAADLQYGNDSSCVRSTVHFEFYFVNLFSLWSKGHRGMFLICMFINNHSAALYALLIHSSKPLRTTLEYKSQPHSDCGDTHLRFLLCFLDVISSGIPYKDFGESCPARKHPEQIWTFFASSKVTLRYRVLVSGKSGFMATTVSLQICRIVFVWNYLDAFALTE